MKIAKFTLFVIAILLSSCSNEKIMGDSTYYPGFLWSEEHNTMISKTLVLDWSEDAKYDNSSAKLQFVDNDGNPVSQEIMKVYQNDKLTDNNTIIATSSEDSIRLNIEFTPAAEEGIHQGFIKIADHKEIDRIENIDLAQNDKPLLFQQWTFEFDKVMNPLAKIFMWIGIIVLLLLLLWFVIGRPIVFPHFRKFKKDITVKQNGTTIDYFTVAFTGCQKVIFSNQKIKQNLFNRIFCGKIMVVKKNYLEQPLTFKPKGKNAMATGLGYISQPSIIPRDGVAKITNNKQNIILIL